MLLYNGRNANCVKFEISQAATDVMLLSDTKHTVQTTLRKVT